MVFHGYPQKSGEIRPIFLIPTTLRDKTMPQATLTITGEIEEIRAILEPQPRLGATESCNQQLRLFKSQDQRLPAIKMMREIFGWGLKEAKDFVDILWENDMHFTPKK